MTDEQPEGGLAHTAHRRPRLAVSGGLRRRQHPRPLRPRRSAVTMKLYLSMSSRR